MKALVFKDRGDIRLMDVSKPALQDPADILLRVTTAAICGTDLHLLHLEMPMQEGEILGHEFAGVVEEVGPLVSRFKPGDRVVSCMFASCGSCFFCRRGLFVKCESLQMFGAGELTGSPGGGQAEFVRVPVADRTLEPIPDGLSDEEALFVGDILATALFGCERAEISPGDTVAVIGAGPLGLLAVQCAHLFGPSRVFAVDRVESRLELAAEFGAIPINADRRHPVEAIKAATGDHGADASVECVGLMPTIEMAVHCVRAGGTISVVGYPVMNNAPFPYALAWFKDLTFRAGYCNAQPYMRPLLDLITAGRLQPARIISHRMKLEEGVEAYGLFEAKEATKVVLTP
ncbi:MAG: zinc-binding dehydrogenase [Candidatus Dormibacteraceae bacterium]